MAFSKVPIEDLSAPFRAKVESVKALGGDPSFFQFAANAEHIVDFYWTDFYRKVFFGGVLPIRVKELVRLRLTLYSGCSFCQVGDSASAVEHGVTEEEIRTLLDPSLELDFLNVAERAAIRFADAVASLSPVMPIQTELHNELASHFSDCELVELFTIVGVLTGMGRMLAASGFIPATCDISGVMPDSTFDK
ncbi:MAG: carboxymuconolactone decarboxylase family protein [Candidatus Nanopelagicales bacterium]|jgi:AhpD family alkylhydroperoxidase|nr:carboxymuconolactone decarboxylase family protein [Candidatus Nanopelagicales bacterium]